MSPAPIAAAAAGAAGKAATYTISSKLILDTKEAVGKMKDFWSRMWGKKGQGSDGKGGEGIAGFLQTIMGPFRKLGRVITTVAKGLAYIGLAAQGLMSMVKSLEVFTEFNRELMAIWNQLKQAVIVVTKMLADTLAPVMGPLMQLVIELVTLIANFLPILNPLIKALAWILGLLNRGIASVSRFVGWLTGADETSQSIVSKGMQANRRLVSGLENLVEEQERDAKKAAQPETGKSAEDEEYAALLRTGRELAQKFVIEEVI